jgi:RHS repeat-associated protein
MSGTGLTVLLTKGSGMVLTYSNPDSSGYLTPQDLDRNALQQMDDATFVETQPDGLQLHYGVPSSSSSSSSQSSSSSSPYSILYVLCTSSSGYSSSSSSSQSSSSSSSCSCSPLGRTELGFQRNLLPPQYAMPHFGAPVNHTAYAPYAGQPLICTMDQESSCQPDQPLAGLYNAAASAGMPHYAHQGGPNALDRAWAAITTLAQGYNAPVRLSGRNAGTSAQAVCQVNLANGNLVVSLSLPSAGPSDPPIRLYYNSLSTEQSEYGFGWSCLYQQKLQYGGSSSSSSSSGACNALYLTKMTVPISGGGQLQWPITRQNQDPCGPITQISNPFGKNTTFSYDSSGNIASITDSGNRTTSFTVDSNGDLTQIQHPDGTITKLKYDNHQLTQWTNPQGDTTMFEYDCCIRVSSITCPASSAEITTLAYPNDSTRIITDALDSVTTLTLDTNGNVTKVQDPESRTFQYAWNSNQRLTSTTDPANGVTTLTYQSMADHSSRLTGIQRPIGAWSLGYNNMVGMIQVTSITDPNNNIATLTWDSVNAYQRDSLDDNDSIHTVTYDYDPATGQLNMLADANGHIWTWAYDATGHRTQITDPLNHSTAFAWNPVNQVTSITNPLNAITAPGFDAMNRQTLLTDANQHTTTHGYDGNGRQTALTNAVNSTWKWNFDADGRVTAYSDPNTNTTTYQWDPVSNLTSVTTPLGFVTTQSWDLVYRLIGVAYPPNTRGMTLYNYDDTIRTTATAVQLTSTIMQTWTHIYDANWRMTQSTDPIADIINTLTYDNAGNVLTHTDPLHHVTSHTWNPQYQLSTTTDANNHTTTYIYDNASLLTALTDATGADTGFAYDPANRRTTLTDPLNHSTAYSYDNADRRTQITDPNNSTVTHAWDPVGNLTALTDPNQNTTTYSYDPANRQTQTTSPPVNGASIITTHLYDPANRMTTLINGLGNTFTYAYDPDNRRTAETDPMGHMAQYGYDAANRPITTTTPLGFITTQQWDAGNRHTVTMDANNNTTTLAYDFANRHTQTTRPPVNGTSIITTQLYDAASRMTTLINGLGNTYTYGYDNVGNRLQAATPLGHTTAWTYDPVNKLLTSTDPLNATTTWAYDPAHRNTSITTPMGFITTHSYDPGNRLTNVLDAQSQLTTYAYDPADNRTAVVDPLGHATTYAYDPLNRHTGTTDPLSNTTLFGYDADSQLTATTSPLTLVTTQQYDPAGRHTATINAANETMTWGYDADARQTAITTPLGFVTTQQYDPVGNMTTVTNPLTFVTTYLYDSNNRRINVVDPLHNTTTFIWNNVDLLAAQTDANNSTTAYGYDPDNRRTQITDPNNYTTAFAFDAANSMTGTTDPLNQATAYTYDADKRTSTMLDALNNTTTYSWDKINRPLGNAFADGRAYSYGWDGNSNRTLMTDPTGTTTWTYDPANRMTGQQDPTGITSGLAYDADSRMITRALSSIGTFTYAYDNANRNTKLTNPLSEITTNTYDADSRLSTRTLANGVAANHGYDAANNLTALTYVSSAGTTLSSFGNAYSPANMRTSVTDVAGNITTFAYDGAYQVASQTGGGSAALGWANMTVSQWANLTVDQWATLPVDGSTIVQTNQYDNSGNALVMVTTAGTVTNSYDPANRMTSSISPLGTTTLTYDGRNRRTSIQTPDGGITTYTWTDDDQLAAMALPNGGGIVTNTYNGDGMRFSRTDANGTNSFAWNGKVLDAQLGAGNTVSTWYTQGMGEYGDIISTRDTVAGASSLQLYDASGNVNQTTDAGANITATLSYDAFGNVTDNSGPANPTVAWQGKQGYQFEQPLGLQYVRQRWYDPATRQFISQDPLGFADGDVNLFRYAGNNPVNANDPGGTALEYIGKNLYWKVHAGETAWGIALRLTGHGANYSKIFQQPPGGFGHLHPGELLAVNPTDVGLIANHHWIAEPGQPAGPTIYVSGNTAAGPWTRGVNSQINSRYEAALKTYLWNTRLATMQYGLDVARDDAQRYKYAYRQGWVNFWETMTVTVGSFGASEFAVGFSDAVTAGRASRVIEVARELPRFSEVGPLFESASQEARAAALLVRLGRSTATTVLTAFFAAYAIGDLKGQASESVERFATGVISHEGVHAAIEIAWAVYHDLTQRAQLLASLNPLITNDTVNLYQARLLHAYNEFRREVMSNSVRP